MVGVTHQCIGGRTRAPLATQGQKVADSQRTLLAGLAGPGRGRPPTCVRRGGSSTNRVGVRHVLDGRVGGMSNCSTARAGGLERAVRCRQGRGGSTGLALDSKKGGCRPLAMKGVCRTAHSGTPQSRNLIRTSPNIRPSPPNPKTSTKKHLQLKETTYLQCNAPHQAVRAHFHANYSFCCSARVL